MSEEGKARTKSKPHGVEIRLRELLAEIKRLRSDLSALKGELLAATQERDQLKERETQRQVVADEQERVAQQKAQEHRLLCFRALIDCGHQTGAYQRHPDFDSVVKRAQHLMSTQLLEAILCFPKDQAPELLYAIAQNPEASAKLSGLTAVPQLFWLMNMGGEFKERAKWVNLLEAGKNAS